MSIESIAASAIPFSLSLNENFRNTTTRTGLVFEGPSGWAEFAPFAEYSDFVSGRWLAGALEQAFGEWPESIRNAVPTNAIIPAVDAAATRQRVTDAITVNGISVFKVKVADPTQTVDDDIVRLRTVRQVANELGVEATIRIDANAYWLEEEALINIVQLHGAADGLDYVEQPCASFNELLQVKRRLEDDGLDIKIAVDEGIRLANNLDVRSIRKVADVIVLKSLPLGGVQRSLGIADELDLPVVVSGSLDTSIGLASGIQLAASVPKLYGACGLGTGALFAHDLVAPSVVPHNGELQVGRQTVDLESLAVSRNKVDEAQAMWWRDRFVRAWHAQAKDLVSDDVRKAVG